MSSSQLIPVVGSGCLRPPSLVLLKTRPWVFSPKATPASLPSTSPYFHRLSGNFVVSSLPDFWYGVRSSVTLRAAYSER